MIKRITLLASVAIAALAVASPAHADALYDKCMDTAQTNLEFGACGQAMLVRRDAELNRVWKAVYGTVDPAAKPELLAEQRAWIAFKDMSCSVWQGGTMGREGAVVHFFVCRAEVIDARIESLRYIAEGGDGAG